jgi:hypothetical protein
LFLKPGTSDSSVLAILLGGPLMGGLYLREDDPMQKPALAHAGKGGSQTEVLALLGGFGQRAG